MPTPERYKAKFNEDCYYHVYNHAVGKENLFIFAENYQYFLDKMTEHLGEYLELLSFCLMPNHFHTLVRVKHKSELSPEALKYLEKFSTLNDCIIRCYNNFFIGYAAALNKYVEREGGLFRKPFRRIFVYDEVYFTRLILYIHYNPVHHKFVKRIEDYKWSSYLGYVVEKPSKLPRQKIWDWFGNKERYIEFHKNIDGDNFKDIEGFIIEDE